MSILLEALKKSEQSRQLGETPTLGTPVEGTSGSDGTPGNMVPALLIVLSAIVMAWFGWQQFTVPEASDTMAEPAVVSSRESPVPVTSDAGEPAPRTRTENYRAAAETSAKSPAEIQSADEGRDTEERQKLRQSVEQFVAEQDSEPEPVARESAPREPASDPGLKPHIAEPISYWELPQGVRDTLPEIRITVLVYADEPGDRFVLSNGQRLVEKDELDSGLVLDEIRRDGAVFKYRNYRFLVKG